MRVLLVVPSDEVVGGVASAVMNLAKDLKAKQHEVYFFHPANTVLIKKKTTRSGFPGFDLRLQMPIEERSPILTIPFFVLIFPLLLLQLVYVLWKYQIDILNIHYPINRFAYFALCRHLMRVSLITSVHGADVFPTGQLTRNNSRHFKFLFSSSDKIVTPSRRFSLDLSKVFPEYAAKTAFIHNCVDLAELETLGDGLSPLVEGSYLLCISAYKEQKAIDVLIDAIKCLDGQARSIKCVIVGSGPLRASLEERATGLGIRDKIEFHGGKSRNEVGRLLRDCLAFVLPSRFETFGIVILEAMAYRKPVIATAAGGIPEIVESGKNGVLVPVNDASELGAAIQSLLADESLRKSLAEEALHVLKTRFTKEHMGSSYEKLFLAARDVLA